MTSDAAFHILGKSRRSSIVITCDHAANRVPQQVGGGSLGLPDSQMNRHIAYDVGAAAVCAHLGQMMDAPVLLSNFSRLVIDPNRGEDDPTLVMKLYDGTLIPGNRQINQADLDWRLEHCYRPYHAAYSRLVASRQRPVIVAIHSFTAQLAGQSKRPWHIGILYGKDRRLAPAMLQRLRAEPDLCVGDNQPYIGHLDGDSIDKHALADRHPNILIEIRNDLIRDDAGQRNWAARLGPILQQVINESPLEQKKDDPRG